MEELAIQIIKWLILLTGFLAISCGLLWLSFKSLTYILKAFGVWDDTIRLIAFYYAVKRSDKVIKFSGKVYRLEVTTKGTKEDE